MKTLEYIDSEIARLDNLENDAIDRLQIGEALTLLQIKSALNRVREVAHADKMAQDKLDFGRRIQSC